MSDKRDDKINDRLDKMSEFYKRSERDATAKSKVSEQEKQKNDILNELPEEVKRQALKNGMSYEVLREFYAEVKAKYYANKASYQGNQAFNNERRQDNVRERVLEQEKERQNEQERTRQRRTRQRQRVYA